MKKNLISILILALLVVNVALTAVMMFSFTSANKKTSALVTNIATVLNLELEGDKGAEEDATVQMADAVSYDIPDKLTVPLKVGVDGKQHYCLVSVSFLMNSKHEDYATLSETFTGNSSYNKSMIVEIFGGHTLEEAQTNPEALKAEILKAFQNEYNSTFIYKVAFSDIMYQ